MEFIFPPSLIMFSRKLEPVFVLGFNQRGLTSKLIKWWTRSQYNHVALLYSLDRCLIIESRFPQGVNINPLNKYLKSGDVIDVYYILLHTKQKERIFHFITKLVGAPYDSKAILGFILKVDLEERYKWFCSELIYDAFAYTGIKLLNAERGYKISPGMLLLSPFLKFFFSLKVKDPKNVCKEFLNVFREYDLLYLE